MIPFTINNIHKMPRNIFLKEGQDLYSGNYKILLKEVNKYMNKCKDIPHSGTVVKITMLPQIDPQIQCNSCQNPSCHFSETFKPNLKFIWKCKGTRIAKIIFKKKKKSGRLVPPDLKHLTQSFSKFHNTRTVWYQRKDRHADGWNRIESRNKPMCLWSTDFQQGCQDNSMGKHAFQQMVLSSGQRTFLHLVTVMGPVIINFMCQLDLGQGMPRQG